MPKFLLLSVGLEPATFCLQSRHTIHSATEGHFSLFLYTQISNVIINFAFLLHPYTHTYTMALDTVLPFPLFFLLKKSVRLILEVNIWREKFSSKRSKALLATRHHFCTDNSSKTDALIVSIVWKIFIVRVSSRVHCFNFITKYWLEAELLVF